MAAKKKVEITQHGNNAAIKIHIKDKTTMKDAGFRKTDDGWFYSRRLHGSVTFSVTIKSETDWRIDVDDDDFGQPYDYQTYLANNPQHWYAKAIELYATAEMMFLKHYGIVTGWEEGDYL